jgi:hypothetical protein
MTQISSYRVLGCVASAVLTAGLVVSQSGVASASEREAGSHNFTDAGCGWQWKANWGIGISQSGDDVVARAYNDLTEGINIYPNGGCLAKNPSQFLKVYVTLEQGKSTNVVRHEDDFEPESAAAVIIQDAGDGSQKWWAGGQANWGSNASCMDHHWYSDMSVNLQSNNELVDVGPEDGARQPASGARHAASLSAGRIVRHNSAVALASDHSAGKHNSGRAWLASFAGRSGAKHASHISG